MVFAGLGFYQTGAGMPNFTVIDGLVVTLQALGVTATVDVTDVVATVSPNSIIVQLD